MNENVLNMQKKLMNIHNNSKFQKYNFMLLLICININVIHTGKNLIIFYI